jgi:hypothetical protein
MVVICQWLEICCWLSAGCVFFCVFHVGEWRLFVSYMRQVCVVCRVCLHSVNYLRLDGGYLSVAWCMIAVVCRMCVCTLSVTWSGMAVICQLHENVWRDVYTLSVTWNMLMVVCRGVYYVSYLRQVLLFSAGCVYSVFYLRQVIGCQ